MCCCNKYPLNCPKQLGYLFSWVHRLDGNRSDFGRALCLAPEGSGEVCPSATFSIWWLQRVLFSCWALVFTRLSRCSPVCLSSCLRLPQLLGWRPALIQYDFDVAGYIWKDLTSGKSTFWASGCTWTLGGWFPATAEEKWNSTDTGENGFCLLWRLLSIFLFHTCPS